MFAMADGAPSLFQVLGNSDALHGHMVEVSGMQPCEGAAAKQRSGSCIAAGLQGGVTECAMTAMLQYQFFLQRV